MSNPTMTSCRPANGKYEGDHLNRVAFPLGGIGSGMICLGGAGGFTSVSLRHHPNIFLEPILFSAISIRQGEGKPQVARVLEGPVPEWKIFHPWGKANNSSGNGGSGKSFGLPRFQTATFSARFPFAEIELSDPHVPLVVKITGWSPFIPNDSDNSSLPVAGVEYHFSNPTNKTTEAVYSFHAENFISTGAPENDGQVSRNAHGFTLEQRFHGEKPWDWGHFSAWIDDTDIKVNPAWFRGGWFDPLTMLWKSIQNGDVIDQPVVTEGKPSPGGSLYLPIKLAPGEKKGVILKWAWYVPNSDLQWENLKGERYRPWYAKAFSDIAAVTDYWRDNYPGLRARTQAFTDAFYDSTLPPEVIDAVSANLTILKSPTVLRQFDGRLWAWEGCQDEAGSCHGSCTHVWNYAQALSHLFPDLERSLRETEFFESQDERGHQVFRATLPIGKQPGHGWHAAADGQLGGVIKVYRDWRISGDLAWLRQMWPKVRQSLDYCIETWDPTHCGILAEPHHNTYDIEFWGPDGMCTSFYLGALKAALEMGKALVEEVPLYGKLLQAGRTFLETELFNGDYFFQKIQWKGLRASNPVEAGKIGINMDYSPEAQKLLEAEGPKYQYGAGCLSDGIIGAWMGWAAGLESFLDAGKVKKHLVSVFKYNFKKDLFEHANPQRSTYALGHEPGLLLCTWPRGGRLSLPMVYSEEVWTGIEYQVAAHLISLGNLEEGLTIVRAVRARYDGRIRNPFNEYECGHWYARAMASYSLLQALSGARYDAVEKTLHLEPKIKGDFRSFLSTATGFGVVGVKDGKPFLEVKAGQIEVRAIEYKT
ncbi:MAG: non-lysosomal glucosylceramidase [Methylacidiphilales bacterium]|nr:non-lysosomal glucosylceramidase [Candidatus Methylacidiphilales bacterium]